MRLPESTSSSSAPPGRLCALLLTALGVCLLGLTLPAAAQERTRTSNSMSNDDVVFAVAFSPDGRTLAIARGSSEPVRRFGRIELWDVETLKLRVLIKGFDGPVRSISFSPDGQTLISGSTEFRSPRLQQKVSSRKGLSFAELKWWDTQTGVLKHKLTMPGDDSYSVRAIQSPDGKQVALLESFLEPAPIIIFPSLGGMSSIGLDLALRRMVFWPSAFFKTEMKLVDAQTGEPRSKLNMDQPGVAGFSPDGNLLAVANGKEVKLWNPQTGKEVGKLKDLRGTANALAFSPDGRILAVVSTRYDREYEKNVIKIIGFSEIKLFDVGSGKVSLQLKDLGAINTLVFSPDGRILIAGGVLPENNRQLAGLKFFDAKTGRVKDFYTGAGYKEAVDNLVLSRSGDLLAFRSGPATVRLLDTRNWTVKETWDANSIGDAVERPTSRFVLSVTRVLAVAFSADGVSVSGESDQGEIKSWDYRTGEVRQQLSGAQADPSLVTAATDGKSFAEVSQGKLLLSDLDSDTKRELPLPGSPPVSGLALSADGQLLALASGNDVMLLSRTGEVLKKLAGGSVSRFAFSNDGRLLAGADEYGRIRIWQVASGSLEKTLMAGKEITAMAFAPNGATLATAAADNKISLWNLQTGLSQANFQKHLNTINALAFSPNGQLLASGSDDRTIILWEVATGKLKRTFKGHDQTVASLAFSPDGQLLASGSGNASVVLWEVGTGKLNRVLN